MVMSSSLAIRVDAIHRKAKGASRTAGNEAKWRLAE
jgi:hypothetical protein